jgi:hypothetical protein
MPTRPYTSEHKGKVKSDVNYVKINASKGHQFPDIATQSAHFRQWEEVVAGQRIHGTTNSTYLHNSRILKGPLSVHCLPSPSASSEKADAPSIAIVP